MITNEITMTTRTNIGCVAQISFSLLILCCMSCRRSSSLKVANIELSKDLETIIDTGSGVAVSHVFQVRNPAQTNDWHLIRAAKSCVCDGNVPAELSIPAGRVYGVSLSGRLNSDDKVMVHRLHAKYETDIGDVSERSLPRQLQLTLTARVVPRLAVTLDSHSTVAESVGGRTAHFLSGTVIYRTLPSETVEEVSLTSDSLLLQVTSVSKQSEKGILEQRMGFRAEVPMETIEQTTNRHSSDIFVHLDGETISKRVHFVSASGVICEPSAVFLRGSRDKKLLGSVTLRSHEEFGINNVKASTSRIHILGDASQCSKMHKIDFELEMSETAATLEKHELVFTLDRVGYSKTRLPVFVFPTKVN